MEDKKFQIFDEFLLPVPDSETLVIVRGNRGGGQVNQFRSVLIKQFAIIKRLEKALDKAIGELMVWVDDWEEIERIIKL